MRIKPFRQEKAAYLYLRNHFHYSITTLSETFGRSTSFLHKIFKFNTAIGALPKQEQKQFLDMLEKQHPKVFKAWIENTKYNPDEWFEDFEKQLREILEFEEKEGQSSNRKRSMVAHFQIDLLKEILGE